jgi:hypothetical protein
MERTEEAFNGVEIGAGVQDVGRIGIGEQCFALGFSTMTPKEAYPARWHI